MVVRWIYEFDLFVPLFLLQAFGSWRHDMSFRLFSACWERRFHRLFSGLGSMVEKSYSRSPLFYMKYLLLDPYVCSLVLGAFSYE